MVVAAKLVDADDDAGCSADPCSGDDVGGTCSVYLSARDDLSVPNGDADSPTTWPRVAARKRLLVVISARGRLSPSLHHHDSAVGGCAVILRA